MGSSVFQFSHLRVFSSLVFGFRFLSMMAVSGFLCPMHFTVSLVFPIATCSRVKTVMRGTLGFAVLRYWAIFLAVFREF